MNESTISMITISISKAITSCRGNHQIPELIEPPDEET